MPWSKDTSDISSTPIIDTTIVSTPLKDTTPNTQENPKPTSIQDSVVTKQVIKTKPENVWTRITDGYALNKINNKRIDREYNWYKKHPKYFERIEKRAKPYLYYILSEAEKRQMPTEMVLLPIVESAFQPFAYSSGRASGLWQFIPSTGRMYGLKQNWWYDGRRDVLTSTKAALDYLSTLAKRFDGDWELALASYNAGAGNVRKAIRKNKRKNLPTDYWSLNLPKETQTYIPRLLAISKIILNAEKLGIQLQDIPNEIPFSVVNTGGQIDLAKAAEMADISLDDIYQLNPAYNRWATDPDGPHRLVIPKHSKQQFETKLARLSKKDRVQWSRYKIKNGDTLGVIAKKHNTTIKVVKNVNKMRNSRIRAGKYLLIPISSKDPVAYRLSATQRLSKKQNTKRTGNRIDFTVRPGDNLWDIAQIYKTSHRKIAAWNGVSPDDTLRPGQKLVLWIKAKEAIPSLASNAHLPSNGISNINYTIRKGDSLSHIADKFNVTINDLKNWNRLSGRYLQPGQKLKLKVNITEQL